MRFLFGKKGLSVSRPGGLILIHAWALLMPTAVWAQGLTVNGNPNLFFASPDSVLDDNLEERQVSRDQILFPERRGGSFGVYAGVPGLSYPVQEASAIGPVASFSLVDPWEEEPGFLGNANLADQRALEAEWEAPEQEGYSWGGAIGQALLFTTIGHVFRVASEEKTRRELDGPFFKDWFKSAGALFGSGWSDGGRDFTNYVIHPLSGSVYGHIYRQNHPQDRDIRIALSKEYFGHMGKTTVFSFVASLAWEIGPYSEASIGNVGLYNTPESQQMTWGDVVVTPLFGVWGVMVIEDLLERFVIRKVEAQTANRWIKALFRIPLTPTRSAANLMAIKRPDYRPDRQ
jgi:hypothetical protein